jgi:hypothetical protein
MAKWTFEKYQYRNNTNVAFTIPITLGVWTYLEEYWGKVPFPLEKNIGKNKVYLEELNNRS